jgi:two-component system cell cycle sensor histidine kinase/response regulator CckA
VVLNLLVNAAQAIPEGRADANQVTVRTLAAPRGNPVLEVIDTGSGIEPEVMRRVFDPFFTTKPVGQGTGIGLSISHAIVTELGWTLTLENNACRGCTARVVIPPRAGQSPEAEDVPPPTVALDSTRARILVVDDEPHVARAIQRALAREHDVSTHTRAGPALAEIAAGAGYDVILCDLVMPELSGPDFVERLEQLAPVQARRVVLMTGGAFTPRAREFIARSQLHVLDKPFDSEDVRAAIHAVMSRTAAGS